MMLRKMNLECGTILVLNDRLIGCIVKMMEISLWRNVHQMLRETTLSISGDYCTHPSNQEVKRLICFVSGEWYYICYHRKLLNKWSPYIYTCIYIYIYIYFFLVPLKLYFKATASAINLIQCTVVFNILYVH